MAKETQTKTSETEVKETQTKTSETEVKVAYLKNPSGRVVDVGAARAKVLLGKKGWEKASETEYKKQFKKD